MTVSSMTGFARVEGALDDRRWIWEARSVNGRGLELRFRTPPGFDALEPELRRIAGEEIARGSVNATLSLERQAAAGAFRINPAALEEALRLVETIGARIDCERPRAEGILALRGVLETEEGEIDEERRAQLHAALAGGFRSAMKALSAARKAEGTKLAAVISGEIDDVARLVASARAHAEAGPAAIRGRIETQLKELLAGAIAEERLAQEAALLALKADIREELDRLDAHVEAARALLAAGEPVGRKLDFLTQEFNREANTLCSKAQDMGLKRIGLDLKSVIDQMREQVQNIE